MMLVLPPVDASPGSIMPGSEQRNSVLALVLYPLEMRTAARLARPPQRRRRPSVDTHVLHTWLTFSAEPLRQNSRSCCGRVASAPRRPPILPASVPPCGPACCIAGPSPLRGSHSCASQGGGPPAGAHRPLGCAAPQSRARGCAAPQSSRRGAWRDPARPAGPPRSGLRSSNSHAPASARAHGSQSGGVQSPSPCLRAPRARTPCALAAGARCSAATHGLHGGTSSPPRRGHGMPQPTRVGLMSQPPPTPPAARGSHAWTARPAKLWA
mmetsp:Transcript_19096/g.59957  ORF Transcript_19096/g.59957 Transcript_19096/m.59957 type:complete len:268 (+) Transcript_19096:3-806(+)